MSDLQELQNIALEMLQTAEPVEQPSGAVVAAIVSAYYAENYLEGRIINLAEQTIPVEIIVVCQDGSQELEIAEGLAAGGYPMKIITTANVPTIYRAWNIAIKQASPSVKYLTNANCDDRLRLRALQEMVRVFEGDKFNTWAVVYGNQEIVEEIDGPVVGKYEWMTPGMDTLGTLLQGCFVGPQPVWMRSLHEKYGLFDEDMHIAGDYEFWLRIAKGGERFYHTNGFVGQYLRRKNGAEHREPVRTVWETARARARYRGEP